MSSISSNTTSRLYTTIYNATITVIYYFRNDDDDDEIAYVRVSWKTRELVRFTSSNEELKTMSRVETENGAISRGSQSVVSMVRDLWWKGFTEKVSVFIYLLKHDRT